VKVEGKGGVILTEVDKVKDVSFFLKESFDECEGVLEGSGVEKGSQHYK